MFDMTKNENLSSENNEYVEDFKFDRHTWSQIHAYTHLETEKEVRKYMYNKAAEQIMKWHWSRDYVKGFLDAQKLRINLKSEAVKQDKKVRELTEVKK